MKTILITGIGGDIAQNVAEIVRSARPSARLVGIDMGGQHGGRLFVDQFAQVPAAHEAGYVESVLAVIDTEGVDCVIPMSEPELQALLPTMSGASRAKWIFAGTGVVGAGLDKLRKWLDEKIGQDVER